PDIIFWQHWTPNPGLSRLDQKNWPELDAYTDAVAAVAARHQSVIAIDLMNEPSTLMDIPAGVTYTAARARGAAFVEHIAGRARKQFPAIAETIGAADLRDMQALARYQGVLSIHSYQLGEALQKTLEDAAAFARASGKPVLLTEGLANTDNWLKLYG